MEGLRKYDGGSVVADGRMGIQLQSASLPSHIRPMEAVRLFAKWNRVEADRSMLASLGIQELAKSNMQTCPRVKKGGSTSRLP